MVQLESKSRSLWWREHCRQSDVESKQWRTAGVFDKCHQGLCIFALGLAEDRNQRGRKQR